MATAMVSTAFSVVGKALTFFTDDLLKDWAASMKLGDNVTALEQVLLEVKPVLEHIVDKEIHNSALKKHLEKLQEHAYDAEDMLDEMNYFCIQDELERTFDAADQHTGGCAHILLLHVKHTAKAVLARKCLPASCLTAASAPGARNSTSSAPRTNTNLAVANPEVNGCLAKLTHRSTVGKFFPCSSPPSVQDDDNNEDSFMHNSPHRYHTNNEPPKLKFDRVDASYRMQAIVNKLQDLSNSLPGIIATIGPNWSAVPNLGESRRMTKSESIEPKLYGRDLIMDCIIHDITKGKHSSEILTVVPIVGPGGIGKTALAQHIYHSGEVQQHFDVRVWTCVSLNFNVNKLTENIEKAVPKAEHESEGTAAELIGKRLRNKRFLLVLDDMWVCAEQDWEELLLPFKKSQERGNIIIVTTRIPAQAQMVGTTDCPVALQGLEQKEFKELFLQIVFGNVQSGNDHRFLLETGDKIVDRLKGSPLAAKTVGRLLKAKLDLGHWTRVLESNEWEQQDNQYDNMPALKLSYDYLPLHLKKCFSYCALFPQDYKFEREELINFWIGLEVLHSTHSERERVEDIGLRHVTELVNHGFLEMEGKKDGETHYIIHDLLHELARKVSAHECLSLDISQSQVSSQIPTSTIRHLSINIDATSVQDKLALKNCSEDFITVERNLKVGKLRSLMLFGEHHGCLVKAFGNLFREAKALRVVFLSNASYDVEDLFHNFYNLIHLRYLRIQKAPEAQARFPNKLSRFYHMLVLDAKCCDAIDLLPRDMCNLVKLRHFLVPNDAIHCNIIEVGKLRSLQELRSFAVKQESQGFELREIGHLEELRPLCICNLENVQARDEAEDAKLNRKRHLHELTLSWNIDQSTDDTISTLGEHVLERLQPNDNLRNLCIAGHKGGACPSWLRMNLSVKNLQSLFLVGVSWKTFPPIRDFWLVNVPREEISGNIPNKRFQNLRNLVLVNLQLLEKWSVLASELFPYLEVLVIGQCSNLVELSFSQFASCEEASTNLFPKLSQLVIKDCPQLLSFPPVPWTESPCSMEIEGIGHPHLRKLVCEEISDSIYSLRIEAKGTPDNTFFNVLAFCNLTKLKEMEMFDCQPLPLHHLQMLSSLVSLRMFRLSGTFTSAEADRHVKYQSLVESMTIYGWSASGKEFTQLLTYFPKLLQMTLWSCDNITGVGVMGQQAMATPGPSSSTTEDDEAQIMQDTRTEEEIAAIAAEGLLLLPPRLLELTVWGCPELRLLPNPIDNNKEDGRSHRGGGLQGLTSLRWLSIRYCPKLLLSYSSSLFTSCFPFPNTVEDLDLRGAVGMETLVHLSNLSSLTSLSIAECRDIRSEGLLSILAQGQLTKLCVREAPYFFVDSESSPVHEQELPSHSSKLKELQIDDVAGATAMPIRSMLFSSLTTLEFYKVAAVEHFTQDQENLQFVNSLEVINFLWCPSLRYLPTRLHRLPNLKRLQIQECDAIQMRPNDGLPNSLQELYIINCPQIRSLPKDGLPSSLQRLLINACPAIKLLPKLDDLPNSLRELYVHGSGSQELRMQCRKLIGIIPIVKA